MNHVKISFPKFGKVFSVFVFFLVLGIFLFFQSVVMVDAGHVKVVTEFGRVTDRVLYPGLHFKIPFVQDTRVFSTKKVTYETTSAEKQSTSEADYKDYPVDTNTSDGQQVDVYYTVRFSVDPTMVNYVAQNFGTEESLVEKIVKTESRIWLRSIPREYDANALYTGSISEIQDVIGEKLSPIFAENGVILDSIGIREIKFSQSM
jgi:regulator of protease activity HflC (stomatin/prohibitin superfamily)